jgi:O-antigen/teichoic acid export membrane protein
MGLYVLLASFVGHAGSYLYYVVAAKAVEPVEFAAISALIAFATIAFMPVNGIQVAVARDVAAIATTGSPGELSTYLRRLLLRMGLPCVVVLTLLAVFSPALARLLHFGSTGPVLLAVVWIAITAGVLIGVGVTQGQQRFGYLAFSLAGPLGMLRPLLLPLCVLVVGGAAAGMWAMIVATAVGLVVLAPAVIRTLRVPPAECRRLPSPLVTVVALLAFSSLTNVDVLVAQASLPELGRAHYAGAVLLGKIALFAPSALAMVLLPKATEAVERGGGAERPVLLTIAMTGACGLGVAAVLWLMPTSVLTLTFGPEFAASKPMLAPLALVMTGAAVLWVHLTFATAKRSWVMTVGLVGGAVVHWGLLALLHDSPWQIITASAIAIGGLLLAIEVGSGSGIVRMLRAMNAGRAEPGPLLGSPTAHVP